MDGLGFLIGLGVLAFIFVAPIVALVKAFGAGQQIEQLRSEISQLRSKVQSWEQAPKQPQAPPAEDSSVASTLHRIAEAVVPPPFVFEEPKEEVRTPEPPTPVPPPAPPAQPAPQYTNWRMSTAPEEPVPTPRPPAPRRSVAEWEMIIGGNVANRIAAIGMVIVAGFFLKYAYDHHWITPPLIVAIGFAAGLALLLAGSRFHRAGAEVFAQGMLGAGISVLYVTAYATSAYQLVSQSIALAIMALVTVIAVIQALRYNSPVVCILGLLGGYLTPLLIGGHGGHDTVNSFGLFAYTVLLGTGLLAVGLKKDSWAMIDPLVLAGTYATYFAWFDQYFSKSLFVTAVPFLATVWLLFCCVDICRIVRSISTHKDLRALVSIGSSGLFYLAMYMALERRFPSVPEFKHWVAIVSLAIGAVYFISLLITVRSRSEDRSFVPRYTLTAITLLAVSTGFAYTGYLQSSLWAVEGLAFLWCGTRWKLPSATYAGFALFGVAGIGLITQPDTFAYQHLNALTPVWNHRFVGAAVLALALGLAAFIYGKSDADDRDTVRGMLQAVCCAVVLALLAVETNDYFRKLIILHPIGTARDLYDYTRYISIGCVWALYSVVLMAIGLWRRNTLLAYLGAVALVLGTCVVVGTGFTTDHAQLFAPIANPRAAGFGIIIVTLILGRTLLGRCRAEWADDLSHVVRVAIALLLLQLLSVETYMLFSSAKYGVQLAAALRLTQQLATYLALGVVWVIYSVAVTYIGLKRRSLPVMVIGLGALLAGVYTLALQGFVYSPLSMFALIANPRFAAFAVAIFGLLIHHWMLAKHRETYPWIGAILTLVQIVASLLAFELVTSETSDYFGRMALDQRAVNMPENMRQMALSVAWLIYSFVLVSIGFWRRRRTLRFVAFGLFAIAIFKVFISDLSFLEPLYRIFSFAGLAVILFATSYLYQRYRSVIVGDEPAAEPLPTEVG